MNILWYAPFWTLFTVALILAGISAATRKLRFVDIQIIMVIIALAMSCDMLFCKQYELYHYVNREYKGWYSFWANLVIVPSLGLVFIKFVPKSLLGATAYIAAWTVASTLFELFVTKPLGILVYSGWNIFPHSTIGYILTFTFVNFYYKKLLKHCK